VKKIDLALLIAVAILLMIALASLVKAGWDQPQLMLKPGESAVAEFTNTENVVDNLAIQNVSAPTELLPYVSLQPSSVPALSAENVTISFIYVPSSVLETMPRDMFAIKISGLIVYLDISAEVPSENVLADVYARMDNLLARIRSLETNPDPSLQQEIDDMRVWLENINSGMENAISENSDFTAQEIEIIKIHINDKLTEMKGEYEQKIAEAEERSRSNAVAYAGIAVLVSLAIVYIVPKFLRRPEGKLKEKSEEKRPSESEGGETLG